MSEYTRPATGPPPVSAGWTIADKYRALLIRDGSTQGFNSLAADVDGLLKPLLARLAAAEAERDANDKTANFYAKQALEVEEQLEAARAENAGLREALRRCVDAVHLGYGVNTCGCLACKAARRLLEAKHAQPG